MVQTNTKRQFDDVSIDSYCINRLYCSFPLPLLIFIYSIDSIIDGVVDLTRSQCKVCDTLVTVKAHGLLFQMKRLALFQWEIIIDLTNMLV